MMAEDKIGHLVKLPLDAINEAVEAEPRVAYSEAEIAEVLADLHNAVDKKTYVPQTPTTENPALSDDYVFDTNDQNLVFKYACKLLRRDAQSSDVDDEDILIYIKVNDRKTPFEKVFVISFHKNRPKH
jgi:hypothetical protein